MIQEVVRVETELQPLGFADLEVLEHSEIRVHESRSVDRRGNRRSVLTRTCRQRQTIAIDELMILEIRTRIARPDWVEREVRCSIHRPAVRLILPPVHWDGVPVASGILLQIQVIREKV